VEIVLTPDEYCRLVYTTIPCNEERCMARRGEACRPLIKTRTGVMRYPHFWRRIAFTEWKKKNSMKFTKLISQLIEQREEEVWESVPS
jgi:hypothetical protein